MAIYKSKFTGEEIDEGVEYSSQPYNLDDGDIIPEEFRNENFVNYTIYYGDRYFKCVFNDYPNLVFKSDGTVFVDNIVLNIDMSDGTFSVENDYEEIIPDGNFSQDNIVVGGDDIDVIKDSGVSIHSLQKSLTSSGFQLQSIYDVFSFSNITKNTLMTFNLFVNGGDFDSEVYGIITSKTSTFLQIKLLGFNIFEANNSLYVIGTINVDDSGDMWIDGLTQQLNTSQSTVGDIRLYDIQFSNIKVY